MTYSPKYRPIISVVIFTGRNSFPEKTFTVTPTMYGRTIKSLRWVLIGLDNLPAFADFISSINFLFPSVIPLVRDRLCLELNNKNNFSNDVLSRSALDSPL